MKKTILTTVILFTLLSCSKDENTSGSGSKCLNYDKMLETSRRKKSDKIRLQNDYLYWTKTPYRYDSTKYLQSTKDSIALFNRRIDTAIIEFKKDSVRIRTEAIEKNCPFYF